MLKHSTLVTAKHLSDAIAKSSNAQSLRILDATWYLPNTGKKGVDNYKNGHIPGAVFFDIDACSAESEYDHMLPTESQFADYVGNLGINNNTHVVLYNDHPDFALFSAPRVWWTFHVFGHKHVSILEGGLRSWRDAGFKLDTGVETAPKESFTATIDSSRVIPFGEIASNISSQKFQLMDARSTGRFHGIDPEPRADIKSGHIPGSSNIPFINILDPHTSPDGTVMNRAGAVKSPDELRSIFNEAGVDLNKPLTATCGSGVTACCLVLAAYLCGKQDTRVYDGAWTEWYKRSLPEQRVECSGTD